MSGAVTAHVVAFDKGIEGTAFRCEHCTLTYSPPMPMVLAKYIEQAKGFGLMHRGCEKPVAPSKQTELFDPLNRTLDVGNGQRMSIGAIVDEIFPDEADAEPDPETDPGEGVDFHSCYCGARFAETWQRVDHWETCAIYLGKEPKPDPVTSLSGPALNAFDLWRLIKCVRPAEYWPPLRDIERWHPDVRTRVQDWCRNEHAHASPIAGVTLPERTPLPNVLAALEFPHPKKPQRGARPLSSGPKKTSARKAKAATAPNGSSA